MLHSLSIGNFPIQTVALRLNLTQLLRLGRVGHATLCLKTVHDFVGTLVELLHFIAQLSYTFVFTHFFYFLEVMKKIF